jgi:hypothetical protein
MAHSPPTRTDPPSQPRTSLFANLGGDLKTEVRMVGAWLWTPLKMGLEAMLRFGLRSNETITIMERYPGPFAGILSPLDSRDSAGPKPAASPRPGPSYAGRAPKRFLAARHADE